MTKIHITVANEQTGEVVAEEVTELSSMSVDSVHAVTKAANGSPVLLAKSVAAPSDTRRLASDDDALLAKAVEHAKAHPEKVEGIRLLKKAEKLDDPELRRAYQDLAHSTFNGEPTG